MKTWSARMAVVTVSMVIEGRMVRMVVAGGKSEQCRRWNRCMNGHCECKSGPAEQVQSLVYICVL